MSSQHQKGVGGVGGSTPIFWILKIGGNYFFIFADKNSSEISDKSPPTSQHTFSNIGHQRLKSSPRHGITFMRSPFLKPFISYYIKIISYDFFFDNWIVWYDTILFKIVRYNIVSYHMLILWRIEYYNIYQQTTIQYCIVLCIKIVSGYTIILYHMVKCYICNIVSKYEMSWFDMLS